MAFCVPMRYNGRKEVLSMTLLLQAITRYLTGLAVMGLVLFLPAGTWRWPNGWLLCGLLFLSMPLVLGSWIAFGLFLVYPAILVKRILGEEKLLEAGLPGYTDYEKKVRCRMIPFLW